MNTGDLAFWVIILGLLGLGIYFFVSTGKKKDEEPLDTEELEYDDEKEEEIQQPSIVDQKVERAAESVEAMTERLKNLTSLDADKPFAKMSTPEIAEVPKDAEPAPTVKKKRSYKRKPKARTEDKKD